MEFKLGTANIMELGNLISDKLHEYGVIGETYNPILSLILDKDKFSKVDEDLYYRMHSEDDKEFIPSENEIIIDFENVKMIINNGEGS